MNNENQYALITGATMGIGYELAKIFAEHGFNLILVARTQSDLDIRAEEFSRLYDVHVITIAKDLSETMAPFEVYEEVRSRGIIVDILVNDAGQGVYGKFVDTDILQQLQIIQLNIGALTVLTYLFLKDMIARNEGKILQLASVASEMPHPLLSVYGGTKAYVLSFTEALYNEVKDTNVVVTALLPGATETDFFNKAGAEKAKVVQEGKMADPAKVAQDGFDALMRGDDKIISGFKNKVMAAMSHIMPDTMTAEQVKKQQLEEADNK
jgi:uncharacterized protein